MAKRKGSVYTPGRRGDAWLKVKTRNTADCIVIGYTKGKGDRASSFGALHLAQRRGGELAYVGKVGTGFDDKMLLAVFAVLKEVPVAKRAVKEKPLDDKDSVWLQPAVWCEVQYASLTPNQALREPVFVRLRPDLEDA
jgi:ATP-dependent DNA ligase